MVLAKALNREAYDVETASSAREALARLTRSDFDVVISDIRMPEFDGRQLFAFIQDHFPDYNRRIVFLTGDVSDETLDFIGKTHITHFTKPPDLGELLEAIEHMVGRRQQAAAAGAPGSMAAVPVAPAANQQLTRLTLESAQLRREVADREREITELTSRLDRASHDIAAARLQASTATEELNTLRDEIADKEREISRLNRRVEHAEAHAAGERQSLTGELERLRKQIALVIADLEAQRSENSRATAEIQAQRAEHERRHAELESELRSERQLGRNREDELLTRLRAAEAAGSADRPPVRRGDDEHAGELEEILVTFYRAVVRPLTIASAHLEMAADSAEPLDADTISELNAATAELKRRLAELAHRMESLGIKVTSG